MEKTIDNMIKKGKEYEITKFLMNDEIREKCNKSSKEFKKNITWNFIRDMLKNDYPIIGKLIEYKEEVNMTPESKKAYISTAFWKYLYSAKDTVNSGKRLNLAKNRLQKRQYRKYTNKEISDYADEMTKFYVQTLINFIPFLQTPVVIDFFADPNSAENNSLDVKLDKEAHKMRRYLEKCIDTLFKEIYPNIHNMINKDKNVKNIVYEAVLQRDKEEKLDTFTLKQLIKEGILEKDFFENYNFDLENYLEEGDQELIVYCTYRHIITPEEAENYIDYFGIIQELKEKNVYIPQHVLLSLVRDSDFIEGYLEKKVSIDKAEGRNINLSSMIENKDLSVSTLIEVYSALKRERKSIEAKKILNTIPSKEKIEEYSKEGVLSFEDLIMLDKIGLSNINSVIDAYKNKQENISDKDKEKLTEYLSDIKILELINNNDIKTLAWIKKNVSSDIIDRYEDKILENRNIEEIIQLHRIAIIPYDRFKQEIQNLDILNLYENGEITVGNALYLYNNDIITSDEMTLIMMDQRNEIMLDAYCYGILSLEKLKELNANLKQMDAEIDGEFIKERYLGKEPKHKKKGLYPNLYMAGIVGIDSLEELYKDGHIENDEILKMCLDNDVSAQKLQELYYKGLIGTLTIDRLVSEGKITKQNGIKIKNVATAEHILNDLMQAKVVKAEKYVDPIFSGEELEPTDFVREKGIEGIKNYQGKRIIHPKIRDEYLKESGYSQKIVQKEKPLFKGYELYFNPDTNIVVAESLFKETKKGIQYAYGEATYLFHIREMNRMVHSTKRGIIEDLEDPNCDIEVRRAKHFYKTWAKNIRKYSEELSNDKTSEYDEEKIEDLKNSIKNPKVKDVDRIEKEISEGNYNIVSYDER